MSGQDAEVITGDSTVDDSGFDAAKPDPALERRAREMGWVPESEWKGDAPRGGFRSAEEFIARGEEVLPVVRSQLEKERKKAAELAERLSRVEQEGSEKFSRLERMTRVAMDKQREQIMASFEARKEEAIERADTAAYRQLNKEQNDALADLDEKLKEPERKETKTDQLPAPIKETIDGWVADNRWYDSDEEMKSWAIGYHTKLLKEKPGMTLSENLAEVSKRARKVFPEAFGVVEEEEEPAPRRSAVEGGSRSFGGGGGSLFSKLPADAKRQADQFIKDDGLFLEKGETVEKDIGKARERYAKQYFGDEK
jgi:hypothetical protein